MTDAMTGVAGGADLPPLPEPNPACSSFRTAYSAPQMQDYARLAVESDRARRQVTEVGWVRIGYIGSDYSKLIHRNWTSTFDRAVYVRDLLAPSPKRPDDSGRDGYDKNKPDAALSLKGAGD